MQEEMPDDSGEFENPPDFFPYKEPIPIEDHPGDYGDPIEVKVEAVFITQGEDVQRFVLLTDGERKLPIFIGGFEATSIMSALDAHQPDRPMTHDLTKTIIEKLEGTLDRVVIDDLWGSTYYAKIYLLLEDEEIEVDSRPSDAIAIALRFECPIYVADGILEHGSA